MHRLRGGPRGTTRKCAPPHFGKFGTTLLRKATCVTAISLWQWVKLVWPAYAPRQKGTLEEHS